MATPLDQTNAQQPGQRVEYSAKDVELAVRLGIQALEQGNGIEVIKQAIHDASYQFYAVPTGLCPDGCCGPRDVHASGNQRIY